MKTMMLMYVVVIVVIWNRMLSWFGVVSLLMSEEQSELCWHW